MALDSLNKKSGPQVRPGTFVRVVALVEFRCLVTRMPTVVDVTIPSADQLSSRLSPEDEFRVYDSIDATYSDHQRPCTSYYRIILCLLLDGLAMSSRWKVTAVRSSTKLVSKPQFAVGGGPVTGGIYNFKTSSVNLNAGICA